MQHTDFPIFNGGQLESSGPCSHPTASAHPSINNERPPTRAGGWQAAT